MNKYFVFLGALMLIQQTQTVQNVSQLMQALAAPNLAHIPAGVPASAWHQAVQSLRETAGQVLSIVDENLNNTNFIALITALAPVIRSTIFMIDASGNHLTYLPLESLFLLPRLKILNLDHNHL